MSLRLLLDETTSKMPISLLSLFESPGIPGVEVTAFPATKQNSLMETLYFPANHSESWDAGLRSGFDLGSRPASPLKGVGSGCSSAPIAKKNIRI
eukprot:CAMPEP_0113692206 /NCGR_PEP_ID=MMETSP0038_2-20120614/18944_1 /TAXON_ID=2898 /ORGANISM="Cryptomonas paramecium" /LENGTH=94 /DNA_ID=CAMNT_0000614069 /DNA_START=358 /DNA_END=642 /DNA_ORIENTATION=+ /assembly_acc=CAM_ASM_000170